MEFLRKPETIAATADFLKAVIAECAKEHGESVSINTRTFLASYMIAFRRNKVFITMGERERELYSCSRLLIEEFEAIADTVLASGGLPQTSRMIPLILEYIRRYRAWKIPDQERVVGQIKDALRALYGTQDAPMSRMVEVQIERLREKLSLIAGAAALVAFDVERQLAVPGRRMEGEMLMHELLYDVNFQLPEDMFASHGVEFWDGLLDDLRDMNTAKASHVLEDIRVGVVEIYPLETVYDGEVVVDKIVPLVDSIADVIVRKQSAARAVDFAPRWAMLRADMENAGDVLLAFRNALRFLHDRVNKMRLDMVNANLRAVSWVIRDHGVDVERVRFRDKFSTFERTKEWLAGVVSADAKRAYLKAMVNLVASTTPVTESTCPETLLMDWPRLALVQQDFHEMGVSVPEVFVNLVGMAMPAAAPTTASRALPAFKVAEKLHLVVNVNWNVHADLYEGLILPENRG